MVTDLFDLGIELILFLQNLGDWLLGPMRFFSFLGYEEFFLLVMPVLYWCLDAGIGLRIGLMLLISNGLNGVLKLVFRGPRPYFYTSIVQALSSETSFGAPSGHAQNAASVWGLLAVLVGRRWPVHRKWIYAAAVLLILLIGISRIYLAVHFPSDVLLGWLIGGLLVWAYVRLERVVTARIRQQSLPNQILLVFAASLAIVLLGAAAKATFGAWTIPAAWLENVSLAGPQVETPEPLALSGIVLNAGAFFGLAAGALWIAHLGGFHARGPWWKRLLRYPLGLVGVLLFWFGLGEIFPRGEVLLPYILRYLRYMLVGIWISALAPWLFMRLGLAEKPEGPWMQPQAVQAVSSD